MQLEQRVAGEASPKVIGRQRDPWIARRPDRVVPVVCRRGVQRTEGTMMKKCAFATLAANGLAAVTLGLAAPAVAVHRVQVRRRTPSTSCTQMGTRSSSTSSAAPLGQCTVTSIRPGRDITQPGADSGGDLVQRVSLHDRVRGC